jgi:hypothetical protein
MATRTFHVPNRHKILQDLKNIGLQTGDIIVRQSDSRGPFNIPFSKLVSKLTDSEYSHPSLILVENGEYVCLEVNDRGTVKYRLIDWLDFCVDGKVEVYRYEPLTEQQGLDLEKKIIEYFEKDLDYDFTYSNPDELYCVESVIKVYEECGIHLMDPIPLDQVITGWKLYVFKVCNWLVLNLTGKGFDVKVPVYFVGNTKRGLLSCSNLKRVAWYTGWEYKA